MQASGCPLCTHYKQSPHSIRKPLGLLTGLQCRQNGGMQLSTDTFSAVDLSEEICVHIWNYDMTWSEEDFKTSDQNQHRAELTAKRSLSDLSCNLHTKQALENQVWFEWAGGESLSKFRRNSTDTGGGDLNLMPEQFLYRGLSCHTPSKPLCVSWTCWNTVFRHNEPRSWGIRTMLAHARQEAKDTGHYPWHSNTERDWGIS